MVTEAFTYGYSTKFTPAETMFFNGVEGRIWVMRTRRASGRGWRERGRTHIKLDATHKEIVNRFGLFWIPDPINA